MGYSVGAVARGILVVENAEGLGMLGFDIMKQGIVEIVIGVKNRERGGDIRGHGRNAEPKFSESRLPLCQFDQLAFTKRSPVCRAVHEQQQTVLTLEIVEALGCPKLIGRLKDR